VFCLNQQPPGSFDAEGAEVQSPVEECPDSTWVSIVDDRGDASTNAATTNDRVEVSNRRADQDLPTGFGDNSPDRDNFKIEISDTTVAGDTIAASKVEIEMLKPGTPPTSFAPPRKLNVELKRVGATGNLYRSKYLRLVVDAVDHAVNPAQMLLADWDSSDDAVEILGQVVRVKYTSASNEHTAEATVGSANRTRIRVAVHIVNASVGGAGAVTIADARQRILKWFRRVYAQISMTPKLLQIRSVDPVENLVSISNNTGANASGGSSLGFNITGVQAGAADDQLYVGLIAPNAGDSPMATAARLAALVRPPFSVRTVQNPPTQNMAQGSADLIISHAGGRRILIDGALSTDATQTVVVGRANPANLLMVAYDNHLVGSEEYRVLLQAYDTGDDRIDLFVVNALSNANTLGQAMIPGVSYGLKRAITKVTTSAFCVAASMDGSDTWPTVLSHEVAHVLLDWYHVTNDATQLMHPIVTPGNSVAAAKRFSESAVTFSLNTSFVQEARIRAMSRAVMEPLP
jgi:hypothetical protein